MPPRSRSRVAVIDIGSNSIRLVVFDRLSRAPVPVFNEKVMCGLGQGMGASGRLNEAAVEPALANLTRFVRLARAMRAGSVDLLATAAVREAEDGGAFVAEAGRRCRARVRVVSGKEEARLSAMGVLSGIPEADGIMGDLGGGSLELVGIGKGGLKQQVMLPLGPLRQDAEAVARPRLALAAIDRELARADWLAEGAGRTFYPVGGAWRTLAHIHMQQVGYPLHVTHRYRVARRALEDFLDLVGGLSKRSLAAMPGVSRRRLDIVPFAALVMARILGLARPRLIEFSAYGLREGYVFSRLSAAERRADPLLVFCRGLADHRFGPLGALLHEWVAPLFPGDGPADRRLRLAVCHLSDIAWRDHPDARAMQAFERVLHLPAPGLDHAERVFAATAIAVRYGGSRDEAPVKAVRRLLDEAEERRAVVLGLALRLAYSLSGATPGLLKESALDGEGDAVRLLLPKDGRALFGEAVARRLEALGRALQRPVALVER